MAQPETMMPRLQRSNTFPTHPGKRVSPPLSPAEVSPAIVVREKLRADVEKRRSLKGFDVRANPIS